MQYSRKVTSRVLFPLLKKTVCKYLGFPVIEQNYCAQGWKNYSTVHAPAISVRSTSKSKTRTKFYIWPLRTDPCVHAGALSYMNMKVAEYKGSMGLWLCSRSSQVHVFYVFTAMDVVYIDYWPCPPCSLAWLVAKQTEIKWRWTGPTHKGTGSRNYYYTTLVLNFRVSLLFNRRGV